MPIPVAYEKKLPAVESQADSALCSKQSKYCNKCTLDFDQRDEERFYKPYLPSKGTPRKIRDLTTTLHNPQLVTAQTDLTKCRCNDRVGTGDLWAGFQCPSQDICKHGQNSTTCAQCRNDTQHDRFLSLYKKDYNGHGTQIDPVVDFSVLQQKVWIPKRLQWCSETQDQFRDSRDVDPHHSTGSSFKHIITQMLEQDLLTRRPPKLIYKQHGISQPEKDFKELCTCPPCDCQCKRMCDINSNIY